MKSVWVKKKKGHDKNYDKEWFKELKSKYQFFLFFQISGNSTKLRLKTMLLEGNFECHFESLNAR